MKINTKFWDEQYLWSNFKEKVYFKKGTQGKSVDFKSYKLEEPLYDTELQKECNSTPLSVDDFLVSVEKAIKDGKINKDDVYICHVDIGKVVVAVCFFWYGARFSFIAYTLDIGGRWGVGYVFLAATAKTGTLETSEPLDNLETLPDILTINGIEYKKL